MYCARWWRPFAVPGHTFAPLHFILKVEISEGQVERARAVVRVLGAFLPVGEWITNEDMIKGCLRTCTVSVL